MSEHTERSFCVEWRNSHSTSDVDNRKVINIFNETMWDYEVNEDAVSQISDAAIVDFAKRLNRYFTVCCR